MKRFDDLQLSFEIEGLDDAEDEERAISYEESRKISESARQRFSENAGKGPAWFKDYLGLIEKGWPWRVACYIAWASSPKIGREPKTLEELATSVLGLTSSRQIFKWRKKYAGIDSVVAMMQAAPLWEHRRDVIEALITSAAIPDYKSFNDRKLYLELTGDYVPRSQVEVGRSATGDESEMTDEELRTWLGGENQRVSDSENQEEEGNDGSDAG